jgi:hypothetical protein
MVVRGVGEDVTLTGQLSWAFILVKLANDLLWGWVILSLGQDACFPALPVERMLQRL